MNAQNFDRAELARIEKLAAREEQQDQFPPRPPDDRGLVAGPPAGARLRWLGGDGQPQRRDHRAGRSQGRSEPEGGAASRWRHHPDACRPPGRQRRRRSDADPTRRCPNPRGALDRPLPAQRKSRPKGPAHRGTRQPSQHRTFRPSIAQLSDDAPHIIEGETRLFEGNKTNRESRKEQLEISIVQSGEEIKGLEARLTAKAEELRLVELERRKYTGLFEKGLIDGTRVYTVNREWARLLGERGEIEGGACPRQAAHQRGPPPDHRRRRDRPHRSAARAAPGRRQGLGTQRPAPGHRRPAVADRDPGADRRHRQRADGLHCRRRHHAGGAPRHDRAEQRQADGRGQDRSCRHRPDQARPAGPAALLRLRHATTRRNIQARSSMSRPATSRDPTTGATYYVGEVKLDGDVAALGGRKLLPGMPVEVFISTEERTALSLSDEAIPRPRLADLQGEIDVALHAPSASPK